MAKPAGDMPRRILLVAVTLVLAGCLSAIAYALSQPSMGLRLVPYAPAGSEVVSRLRIADSPEGGPPEGRRPCVCKVRATRSICAPRT